MSHVPIKPGAPRKYIRARLAERFPSFTVKNEEGFFAERDLNAETVYRLNRGESSVDRLLKVARKLRLSPITLFWVARGPELSRRYTIAPISVRERGQPELWVGCGTVEIPAPFQNLYHDIDLALCNAPEKAKDRVDGVLYDGARRYVEVRRKGRAWSRRGAWRRLFEQAVIPPLARELLPLMDARAGFLEMDLIRGLWIFFGHYGLDTNFMPLFDARRGQIILPHSFDAGLDAIEFPDGQRTGATPLARYIGSTFEKAVKRAHAERKKAAIPSGEWPSLTGGRCRMSTAAYWSRFRDAIAADFDVRTVLLRGGEKGGTIGAVVLPARFSNFKFVVQRLLLEVRRKRPNRDRDQRIVDLTAKYAMAEPEAAPLRGELLMLARYLARHQRVNKQEISAREWLEALIIYTNYRKVRNHLPVYHPAQSRYDVPRHLAGLLEEGGDVHEGDVLGAAVLDIGEGGTLTLVQILSGPIENAASVVDRFGTARVLREVDWLVFRSPGQLATDTVLDLMEYMALNATRLDIQGGDVLTALVRFSWERAGNLEGPQAERAGRVLEVLGLKGVTPARLKEVFAKLPPTSVADFMAAFRAASVQARPAPASLPPAIPDRFPRIFDEEGLIAELEIRAGQGDERAAMLFGRAHPLQIRGVEDLDSVVQGANFLYTLLRDGSLHVATIRGAVLVRRFPEILASGALRISVKGEKRLVAYDGGPLAAMPYLAKRLQDFGYEAVRRPGLAREKVTEPSDDVENPVTDDCVEEGAVGEDTTDLTTSGAVTLDLPLKV